MIGSAPFATVPLAAADGPSSIGLLAVASDEIVLNDEALAGFQALLQSVLTLSGLAPGANVTVLTGAHTHAQTLAAAGAGPGATIAITHGGTAHFFRDLIATWSTGAAAACLDPALTPSERENVVNFCKPSLVLNEDGETVRTAKPAPRSARSAVNTKNATSCRRRSSKSSRTPMRST